MLLTVHIVAGALALVLGAAALIARKGGRIHRRVGVAFVYTMLVMGVTAAILGNFFGGLMSIYFVATALATVKPAKAWTRAINIAGLVTAAILALVNGIGGVQAFRSPGGLLNGVVPFPLLFFFAAVFAGSAIGDARVVRAGALRGAPRLSRHIWRMCFALLIAAASFFSIRERVVKILPEPFGSVPMRILPIALIVAAMFYWLWKVRRRNAIATLPSSATA